MPDIFTGSQGDAVSFLEQWRQFLEELLRSETKEPDPETRGLRIYDADRLVYGMETETKQFKDEVTGLVGQVLNPDLLMQLEKLRDTPVGGLVPEAANKFIELDGRIVLQSDSQGQVIINELLREKSQEFTEEVTKESPLEIPKPEPDSEAVSLEDPLPELPEEEEYYSPIEFDDDSSLPTGEIEEVNEMWPKTVGDVQNNLEDSSSQPNTYDKTPVNRAETVEAPNMVSSPKPELLSAVREGIREGNYKIINQTYTGVPYLEKQQVFNSLTPEEQKETKLLKLIHQVEELSGITDGSIKTFVREAMQKQSQSKRNLEPTIDKSREESRTIPGYERVQRSLAALPQTTSVQMAANYSTQMQALLETIQQQNQQINSLQNSVSEMQQLITARVQQPTQFFWWQKAKQTATNLWESFKRREEYHTYAAAIRHLYAKVAPPNTSTIYVANYIIQRDGKNYTFSDQDGQTIMKFRALSLGISLESDVRLQPEQQRDLAELVTAQTLGQQPSGAFATIAQSEGNYYLRVQKLSHALVNYAKSQNSEVEIDGKLSYKWRATPNGEVEIQAKDGRGSLLIQSGGKMFTQLSERDLAYFEGILPLLKSQQMSNSPEPKKFRDNELGT